MSQIYAEDDANTLSPKDYYFVRQYPSLKGLLKPFKGKGEYEALLEEIKICVTRLEMLGEKLINDTKDKLPIKYLPFNLSKRKLKNGSVYLTWRQTRAAIIEGKYKRVNIEGKQLIINAIKSESPLSQNEKTFLIEMENDRLTLNMQMRTCAQLRFLIQDMLPKFDELDTGYKR